MQHLIHDLNCWSWLCRAEVRGPDGRQQGMQVLGMCSYEVYIS
jgi:hypothetical protein